MEEQAYSFIESQQSSHWWFRGRYEIVATFLRERLTKAGQLECLDIGSGFGAMVPALRQVGVVDAIEPFVGCHPALHHAGVRTIHEIEDFPRETPADQYDVVSLFDVLEHIEEDRLSLTVINNKVLRTGGVLILTVPAGQWLWTPRDDLHQHKRRYSRGGLIHRLRDAGFTNIFVSYFMFRLFPFAVLQRLAQKTTRTADSDLGAPRPFANRIMYNIFSGERHRLAAGKTYPVGLSLFAYAEKR